MFGIFIGYRVFSPSSKESKEWSIPDASDTSLRYITEESLVSDIKQTTKIIPLELELSESITIDKSWGDFDVFKKYKKITYKANCSYTVDLSELSTSNLTIDKDKKEVILKLPSPEVYKITIDHSKTLYEETTTGLLRFGEINLSSEEYGLVEREITNDIESKMNGAELYNKACVSTTESMTKLLNSLLGEDVIINISY